MTVENVDVSATTSSDSQLSISTTALADSQHGAFTITPTTSADSQPCVYRNGCSAFRASRPARPRSTGCPPLTTTDDLKILHYDPT